MGGVLSADYLDDGGADADRKTTQQRFRGAETQLLRTQREVARSQAQVRRREEALRQEMARHARAGELDLARAKAKQVAQTRIALRRFVQLDGQLEGLRNHALTARARTSFMGNVRACNEAVRSFNIDFPMGQVSALVGSFAKGTMKLNAKMEAAADVVQDAVEDGSDVEELGEDEVNADAILRECLDMQAAETSLQLGLTVPRDTGQRARAPPAAATALTSAAAPPRRPAPRPAPGGAAAGHARPLAESAEEALEDRLAKLRA